MQRLSLDNLTINSLLDETADLKKKLEEKEEELNIKTDELNQKDEQIKELQVTLTDISTQVKTIEESVKVLKKIQTENLVSALKSKRETALPPAEPSCSSHIPPRPSIRPNKFAPVTNSTMSTRTTITSRGKSIYCLYLNILIEFFEYLISI